MENRSLVTIAEHSKEKILYMLEMAKQFEMNPNRRLLQGKDFFFRMFGNGY
jgi:aspartate carbamoyltransferase catalytic subunit